MRIHKIIGTFIVIFSLCMIAYQATKNESSVTFFTPAEVYANPQKFETRTFRVSGLVLEGSRNWDANSQTLTFEMSDLKGHNFVIFYKGLPPDLFKEKQGVIVEGRLQDPVISQNDTIPRQSAISRQGVIPAAGRSSSGKVPRGNQNVPLHINANLLMVKHSEVYDTKEDHSQMREIKLRESLFNEVNKVQN